MQLINAIEISPSDYSDHEYDFPNGGSAEFPDAWHDYWLRCISGKGLGNLKPVRKGSYLVAMEHIHDYELEVIVTQHLKGIDPEDFEEQISSFCGGIVVKEEDKFLIEPMCCSDISNIYGWQDLYTNTSDKWTELWIGHPWLYYRIQDGIVKFSAYTDHTPKPDTEITAVLRLSETELKAELQHVFKQQDAFRIRICQTLEKMGIAHAERLSGLLTGKRE